MPLAALLIVNTLLYPLPVKLTRVQSCCALPYVLLPCAQGSAQDIGKTDVAGVWETRDGQDCSRPLPLQPHSLYHVKHAVLLPTQQMLNNDSVTALVGFEPLMPSLADSGGEMKPSKT